MKKFTDGFCCPLIRSKRDLDIYFLALDIAQTLIDLETEPKRLPAHAESPYLRAFDEGYTSAICVLYALGYEDAGLASLDAAEAAGVHINRDLIDIWAKMSWVEDA
jgi:hypothetical protein